MDILSMIIGFVGGSSVLASLLVAWIKQKIKEAQENRFTDLAILGVLFLVSLAISFAGYLMHFIPDQVAGYAVLIFGGAITIFEVFYKAGYEKGLRGRGIPKPDEAKG